MPHFDNSPITLQAESAISQGTASGKLWSKGEANAKGIKIMLAIWAGGLFSIVIPIVHFLSVPACLIGGPIAAQIVRKMYAGTIDLTQWTATCPACTHDLTHVPLPSSETFHCPKCNALISWKLA